MIDPLSFDSVDAMLAAAEKVAAKKKPSTSKSAPKKRVDRKKSKVHTDPTPKTVGDENVFRTTHFYVRKGDTLAQVQKDSREELTRSGPGTRIMAHDHLFTETCNERCKGYE